MAEYQWIQIGLSVLGFAGTWLLGAFMLGRAVEQMKANLKQEIDNESDRLLSEIRALERRFDEEQDEQNHRFGEVGASMRQYTADVEKKVREVEIYGRDNYVKIPDFKEAVERLALEIRSVGSDIKNDISQLRKIQSN